MKLQHLVLPTTPERIYGWIIRDSEDGGNMPHFPYELFEDIIETVDQGVTAAHGYFRTPRMGVKLHFDRVNKDYTFGHSCLDSSILFCVDFLQTLYGDYLKANDISKEVGDSFLDLNFVVSKSEAVGFLGLSSIADYLFFSGVHETIHHFQRHRLPFVDNPLWYFSDFTLGFIGLEYNEYLAYEVEARRKTSEIAAAFGKSDPLEGMEEKLQKKRPDLYGLSEFEMLQMLRGRNRS